RVPVDLLIVRSRRQHHLTRDARRRRDDLRRSRRGRRLPGGTEVRVVELRPELVTALLERHRARVHADSVEAGRHELPRRHLRHRPVVRRVPRGVLAGMAGAAGSRRDVAVARHFDGAVGRLAPRQPRAGRGKSSKNGQEGEIFGLARAPEWAHHFCQDLSPDVTAEAVMTKLLIVGVAACTTLSVAAATAQTPAKTAAAPVTFTRDIAPILQRSCQSCHRPGQMAPMSLLTYQDVRPWVRSIKQRVVSREMPPWGIDPHIGIQSFKNDPSLRPDEIEKIVKWVDAGAPMGNAAEMPKPREFDDSDRWHIGKPDLVVTSPKHVVPPEAADWWGSYYVETGLTEDRYIKAIESKPGKTAVVHHLLTYAVDADASGDSNGDDSSAEAGEFLNEFAVGKNGDLFPEGTGRLLKA